MSRVIDLVEYSRALQGLIDHDWYTINSCFNKYGHELGVSIMPFYNIVKEAVSSGFLESYDVSNITLIKKKENKN